MMPGWQDVLDFLVTKIKKKAAKKTQKTTSEYDLIIFCLQNQYCKRKLLEWINDTLVAYPWEKCKKRSISLREDGNKHFSKMNYNGSVSFYTESIQYAFSKSEEMALALANRSAALFHLQLYKEALGDIELAFLNGYASKLQYKLYQRRGACLTALNDWQESINAYQMAEITLKEAEFASPRAKSKIQKAITEALGAAMAELSVKPRSEEEEAADDMIGRIPQVTAGKNEEFPCASSLICVEESPEKGRHVVVREAMAVRLGDVLFVEEPFACVLLPDEWNRRCHHCCHPVLAALPCQRCASVVFCSTQCAKQAWCQYHRWECGGGLNIARAVGIAHLAMRVLLTASSAGPGGPLPSYQHVHGLLTHLEDMQLEDRVAYTLTALCLMLFLAHHTDYFSTAVPPLQAQTATQAETQAAVAALLLRHTAQLVCNGHAITALQVAGVPGPGQAEVEVQVRVATAIYPSASLMNHSCQPNIVNSFCDNWLVVRASRAIPAGGEVLNCYGPSHQRMARAERQAVLRAQYFFDCRCEACLRDVVCEPQVQRHALRCPRCAGPLQAGLPLLRCHMCGCRPPQELLQLEAKAATAQEAGRKLLAEGRWREALDALQHCCSLQKRCLYHMNEDLTSCLNDMARCHAELEHYGESVALLLQALPAVEECFGVHSTEMVYELQKLTDVMLCELQQMCLPSAAPLTATFWQKYAVAKQHVEQGLQLVTLLGLPGDSAHTQLHGKAQQLQQLAELQPTFNARKFHPSKKSREPI